jgi:hypothetical protein
MLEARWRGVARCRGLLLANVLSAVAQVPVGPSDSRPEVVEDELFVKFSLARRPPPGGCTSGGERPRDS